MPTRPRRTIALPKQPTIDPRAKEKKAWRKFGSVRTEDAGTYRVWLEDPDGDRHLVAEVTVQPEDGEEGNVCVRVWSHVRKKVAAEMKAK